ncbi:MAG: DNA-binding protein [Anaerolineae bacterium]
MKKTDLEHLADLRVTEARALCDHQCYAGAYYLLGYAVECALKACIAKQIREGEVPERALMNGFYSHGLEQLLALSGLKLEFQESLDCSPGLRRNWATVRDWQVESRYTVQVAESLARDMFTAVSDSEDGVLTWLRARW